MDPMFREKYTYKQLFANTFRVSKGPIAQMHEPSGLRQSAPFCRRKYQGAERKTYVAQGYVVGLLISNSYILTFSQLLVSIPISFSLFDNYFYFH